MINSIVDHTSLAVVDYAKSLTFYDETLATLGYQRVMTIDDIEVAGYGVGHKPSFWISSQGNPQEQVGAARGVHIAFRAPSQDAVDMWYKKALALGATDNGAPGPRPQYHQGYYGAFVIDPNGWRVEACFHEYSE